jgi:8-oxo-dGTP pyrophosphatase MutT (NUDIX family)
MFSKPKTYDFSPVGWGKHYNATRKALLAQILASQKGGGGGVIPVTYRNGTLCVVVVKENGGVYVGLYNFPCGKHEGNGQVILTMQKELKEEFGFAAGLEKISCTHVLGKTSLIKIGNGSGTVIACALLNTDFSRATVNARMQKNNSDPSLPACYKEMDGVELVPVANILSLPRDGQPHNVRNMTDAQGVTKKIPVSSFLISVVKEFHAAGTF